MCNLLKIMTYYYVPESIYLPESAYHSESAHSESAHSESAQVAAATIATAKVVEIKRIRSNRQAVILQMTQVACQELYFGHIRSAFGSLSIIFSLLLGHRKTGLM
jgi:hypothetical protein